MTCTSALLAIVSCLTGYFVGLSIAPSSLVQGSEDTLLKKNPRKHSTGTHHKDHTASVKSDHDLSGDLYVLPTRFLQQVYLPTFGHDWTPRKELVEFLKLTEDECQKIGILVSEAARKVSRISFDKAEITETSETETAFLVPQFKEQGRMIRVKMWAGLTSLLGVERAHLLESASRKALANEFANYGNNERKVVITQDNGQVTYKELQPSLHHSGEFVKATDGSWSAEHNNEVLENTQDFKYPFLNRVIGSRSPHDQE